MRFFIFRYNNKLLYNSYSITIYTPVYVLVELGNWGKEETQTERRKLQYIFA